MIRIRRRRTLVRIISFVTAALVVTTSAAVYSSWLAYAYRRSIEYSYQRALSELAVHVNSIDMGLQKGVYAGTPSQLAGLTAQIWKDAGAAKTDLAQIPLYNENLNNTYKFISQVGDYANSLTRTVASADQITDEDRVQMKTLHGFANKLSTQLSGMMDQLQDGNLSIFTAQNAVNNTVKKKTSSAPTVEDGFQDADKEIAAMPSLIYDGPFSDNVLKREPEWTKGKAAVTKDQARAVAAAFAGVQYGSVKDAGETAGTLPTWNFSSGTLSVSVTKTGGYVVRMLDSRQVGPVKLDTNAAHSKANAFLEARKIGSMKESYYQTANNICVINFAYTQDGVICYPDLIKVGVALDTGAILSFDSSGYIMNHKKRTFPAAKFVAADAQKKVSPLLKVQSCALVLIPLENASESLCWEVRCKGENNQDVLDYYNVSTGIEDNLLILLQTPGGVLAS